VVPTEDSVPVADAQLAQEMQFIDRARTAMRAGNPALCLQILDEYRRTFERHRLGPESAYLRMQAALKMGDRAMAMEVAREIVRRYPSSPHVGRAEELLQRESEVPDSL
jgi:outer membrane protein assembly factor BamD (BamD/ComL family)